VTRDARARLSAASLVAVLVIAGGCAREGQSSAGSSSSVSQTPNESPENNEGETPEGNDDKGSNKPKPQANVLEATVRNGQVKAPDQYSVKLGESATIEVKSDVADEIHLHGYDIMQDVTPGRPAKLRFKADIPGVFEVELEDAGLLLFEVKVQ
jgi:hypothetical protein